ARAGRAEGGYALTLRLAPREEGAEAADLLDWERRSAALLARRGSSARSFGPPTASGPPCPRTRSGSAPFPTTSPTRSWWRTARRRAPLRAALRAEARSRNPGGALARGACRALTGSLSRFKQTIPLC
ncbi:MAG: hypothetical protein M5U09_29420, partial [Gammaproteobacteria bacterium]|nr:hypothetical protein [Gammaproteobacteria bacterium]